MLWKKGKAAEQLIVGLGNPGKKYEHSLHNVGFRVIIRLFRKLGGGQVRRRGFYVYAENDYRGKRLILLQPFTYMNLSGRAVIEALRWYKLQPARLTVIYDDMDLERGVIRLRPRGGSGGHRGIASIIESLGTEHFARLRVGVDRPPPGMEPEFYLLKTRGVADSEIMVRAEEKAAEAILVMIAEGLDAAMNKFNVLT
ncbi:MAG: aminoacyl-tRNA hydrolase [Firmicutes bacterium]|nr:aminoacyl-tRNA hydrolase [Bacillota bacterium]